MPSRPTRRCTIVVLAAVWLAGARTAALPTQTIPAGSIPPLFDRFELGEWNDGQAPRLSFDGLVALLKDLKQAAPPWIAARGPDQERRRRLVVATFVLQLLSLQEDPFLWQGGARMAPTMSSSGGAVPSRVHLQPLPAVDLLDWACDFLRERPPLVAERWWHLGAIALLERESAVDGLDRHIAHAHARFGSEERWSLASAVSRELRTWPEPRDERPFLLPPTLTVAIVGGYEEALARASVSQEAHVRFGYFELRRGHAEAALGHFDKAGNPADPTVRYWLHLFRGHALERAKRPEDAVASYRRALEEFPGAQSAALALAAALVSIHRGSEAAELTSRTVSAPAGVDPWVFYTHPDYRAWPRVTAELKKAVKP